MQELKRQGKEWTGPDYLATVVPAVLNSLVDADARVRYYACEALYNIAKMSREDFLEPHFNSTFDALFRLVADPDAAVNQACTFLDSLMKARPSPSFPCLSIGHRPLGAKGIASRCCEILRSAVCCHCLGACNRIVLAVWHSGIVGGSCVC